MVSPAKLFRMMTEFVFILLGGILVWVGFSNRFLNPPTFNPRSPAWLGLGAVLIYWGARAWMKTGHVARAPDRAVARVGGASLILVGLMMFSLVALEFRWVGVVLASAGGVLAARGLIGAVLSLRTD